MNDYFPLKTCLSFSQLPKMDALKSKLVEFNGQVSEDKRLSDEDVIRLTELPNTGETFVILNFFTFKTYYVVVTTNDDPFLFAMDTSFLTPV